MIPFTYGVLTISDKGSRGDRTDESGPAVMGILDSLGGRLISYMVVPDDIQAIRDALLKLTERDGVDLVVTTGGTGVHPRDVTPEATREVLEREIPGISEAMRAASLTKTPHGMLSRGIAGIRGRTLIINLPGSPKGARENLEVVLAALPHALEKIKGDPGECASNP